MYLRMNVTTNLHATVSTIGEALAERERAHTKHGESSIEGSHDDLTFLAILVEEVGELAHSLTYDQEGFDRKELIQIIAVAWAWADARKEG